MKGDAIRKNIAYTALVFPSALYAFLHFLNFFLVALRSAGAVPFGTFLAIGALCTSLHFLEHRETRADAFSAVCTGFGINVPLTIIGGWIGVKRGVSRCSRECLCALVALGLHIHAPGLWR